MPVYPRRLSLTLLAFTVALILASCARQEPGPRVEDPADAPAFEAPGIIEFEGRNLFRTVHHTFERWGFTQVDLVVDEGGLQGEVEVEIELASVETGSEWLNRRARSEDFFDAERYPTARLWIGNVTPAFEAQATVESGDSTGEAAEGVEGAGLSEAENPWKRVSRRYRAQMEIDLRGTQERREIAFQVVSESPLVVSGEIILSRSAFGIGPPVRRWNPFSIRDEIPVRFEAQIPGLKRSENSKVKLQVGLKSS